MYSDKKKIIHLCALLKAHGVNEVVLCPGSRNAPIVHSLSQDSDYSCYSITDERSAGFFAIGRILETKRPVAICCTSGSAALNFHPAVSEAFYRKLPLIVITADRPRAWIGQMDGQTLPQPMVYGTLVRMSVDLPEVQTAEDEWYCNRLINEALLESTHHDCGPVHINVPISEPLFRFTEKSLPTVRVIRRYDCIEQDLCDIISSAERLMVIKGQDELNNQATLPKNALILSEQIGNLNGQRHIDNFDQVIYAYPSDRKSEIAPDVLITYGGSIVSKRLKKLIRSYPPTHHIHVSREGRVVDTFACQTIVAEVPAEDILAVIEDTHTHEKPYTRYWWQRSDDVKRKGAMFDFGYSEMFAVKNLLKHLPHDAVLHLGNSSAVRYAQLFEIAEGNDVYCNRGTSGIEGSLSTAVGFAAASDRMNVCLIGDLSFFYDMNGLWNSYVKPNLRIMMLNNGGGEIFQALPGLEITERTHAFVTASHTTSAQGWAEQLGFEYHGVHSSNELQDATERLLSIQADKPIFVEVFTDKDSDVRILKDYYHSLK
ncbi:2-succinyl-5-enolpyruvyl-6-hydroxy-3-cyclohexene-1-carboxylic-acid synthase [Porphyromonadaceae bacterium W3.11]|nr:2-succinyl-5-enolpyruvyl-6-hydroxy-3-cyclohexene-1-carboxylic-acid synthase [Porphyromonadaceae bacterium W3.11]